MVSQKTGTRGRNSSGEAYSATQGELAERALSVLPPPVAAANLPGALAGLNQSPQGYPPRHYPEAVVKGARENLPGARGNNNHDIFINGTAPLPKQPGSSENHKSASIPLLRPKSDIA